MKQQYFIPKAINSVYIKKKKQKMNIIKKRRETNRVSFFISPHIHEFHNAPCRIDLLKTALKALETKELQYKYKNEQSKEYN